jgi:hypothetical protein
MQELINAQEKLQIWESKDASLIEWCNKATVSNIEEQAKVQDLLTGIKQSEKRLIGLEDSMIDPLQDVIGKIKTLFKPKRDQITQIKTHLSNLLSNWRKEQLSITEETIIKRAEDYWDKRKEAEQTGEILPNLPDLNVTPPSQTSHHNMGTTTYRKRVIVRIVKPHLVPRSFCVPVESLLRKHAEMELAQGKELPLVDGVVFELEFAPISRPVKS